MTPRALEAHIDRAIEQSGNQHIAKIMKVSTHHSNSDDLRSEAEMAADTFEADLRALRDTFLEPLILHTPFQQRRSA
ncbi:hypothetical protein S40288_11731 [Stachybotrys chartarum IBT 40288]|nr:hypothetical protein S40288_11731 [Stachybotrys chartarum IBT 40288]